MTFLWPIWLMLAIPLATLLWLRPLPTRVLNVLRAVIFALILLGMARLAVKLPSRAGTVVVIADRSASMPANTEALEREAIDLVQGSMNASDRLAVVSFGDGAAIERAPDTGRFSGFVTALSPDASDLDGALGRAAALIPPDEPGRILVLSDGRWTGKDPLAGAAHIASRNIAIDYRLIERPGVSDLAIASVDAPQSVSPREGFLITAWVRCPTAQEIHYELKRGGARIAAGSQKLPAGLNRLSFRDSIDEPTTAAYTLTVRGSAEDPTPENNLARLLIAATGAKPILFVTERQPPLLANLLSAGGLTIKRAKPEEVDWSIESLSGYSSVVLEEVPAGKVGTTGMQNIAAWVRQTGSGLMMTGGPNGFGPGGYFKSPIEPILPVSLELRREHRKLAVAIVVAMDRSGSMSAGVPGGRTKMDLADLAAAQVLDLLSPMDEFGVLAVDTDSHIIAPLQNPDNKEAIRSKILRVASEGGGIYIEEALLGATDQLRAAKSGTKHIVLFADAADSEQHTGKYREIIDDLRKLGMTCSVIGLGTEHDSDAALLKDVARRGGGNIFFTNEPTELPRLFAQDTFIVARSSFIEDPTSIHATPHIATLLGHPLTDPPAVGGYNLTYLRDSAQQSVTTEDEYKAPVVASWIAGTGRVLCYTGQADGKHTGPIAKWNQLGDTLTGLVRWTAGAQSDLPPEMLLTQQMRNGICTVTLNLDPSLGNRAPIDPPRVSILRARPGQEPTAEDSRLAWVSPDALAIDIPVHGSETSIATVQITGHAPIALPPVTLPYSPEFEPESISRGVTSLQHLARATSGTERVHLQDIWSDLPKLPRTLDLSPLLLVAAIALLLLEVLDRRTGAFSAMLERISRLTLRRTPAVATATEEMDTSSSVKKPERRVPTAERMAAKSPEAKSPEPESQPTPAADSGGLLRAMQKAQRRAQQRSDRPPDA